MKKLMVIVIGVVFCISFTFSQSIRNSKHDLSSTSTTIGAKSTNVDELCVFCHTPHSNQSTTMLWNRTASSATYTVYTSPSMEAAGGQPGSASKNCLSCHDGTVAFNSLINSPGGVTPTMTSATMSGVNSLGTDLSNDHPIGFVYSTHQGTDPHLRAASASGNKVTVSNGGVTLPLVGTTTANATMECTSCHDPHDGTKGQFKRVANSASQMCFTCHNK